MKTYKKPMTHLVRNHIEPLMIDNGFERCGEAQFLAVKRGLVYSVSFGLSHRGGKSIYLYYSAHQLLNIDLKQDLFTYSTGARLSREECDSGRWSAESHESIEGCYGSIQNTITTTALPWFTKMNSTEKYMELCKNLYLENSLSLAIAEALLGRFDRSMVYLENILMAEEYEHDEEEKAQTTDYVLKKAIAQELVDAINNDAFSVWADQLLERNVAVLRELGFKGEVSFLHIGVGQ